MTPSKILTFAGRTGMDPSVKSWIGSLTRQAMLRRVEGGGIAGKAPLGYANIPDSGGHIELSEDTATLVRLAFQMADGSPLRTISKFLFDHKLANRNGKPLGPSTLWAILTNPIYIGRVRIGDKLVKGNHVSLITEEVFERVQTQLTDRARNKNFCR